MRVPFSPAFLRQVRSHALERIRLVVLLTFFVGSSFVDRAAWGDLWWDTNGATAGSSSSTAPTGTFNNASWTTDPAGTSATQFWVPGETAVFSAGTNATYSAYDG